MTKIILTGATGFVGGTVLRQAIADPRITEIIILSRRELADKDVKDDAKIKVILQKDFQRYSPELLEQLKGAEACIWCIGGMVKDFPNAATARKVQVTYAVAFAQALKDGDILPINFVFCSGAWAEREQDKELWYLEETRKIKGEAEAGLAAIAESTPGLNVYHMRLGGVMANTTSGNLTTSLLGWSGPMVSVGQVAAVFVDVALRGDAATNSKTILENDEIVGHKFEDGMRRKSSVFSGGSNTPRPSAEGRRGSWLGNFGRKGSAVGKSAV